MVTDGDTQPSEDEMLPDEREVVEDRGEQVAQTDDDELLTVDEVAADLGLDTD